MPINYTIDLKLRRVVTTLTGALTVQDLLGHYAAVRADPQFHVDLDELCDLSGVGNIEISSREMSTLPNSVPFSKRSRHALIAARPAIVGLARMFQQWSPDEMKTRVFTDRSAAEAWLRELE